MVVMISSASQAYFGVKIGGFRSNGNTNFGGGVVYGLPLPVPGLAVELDVTGYYDKETVADLFFLQSSLGPVYDFNPLITPDSDFLHPFVRAGAAYAFLFSNNDTAIADQHAPGFFTGGGLSFNFPIISIGLETNYNYVNFNSGSNGYWSYFISGGIHF